MARASASRATTTQGNGVVGPSPNMGYGGTGFVSLYRPVLPSVDAGFNPTLNKSIGAINNRLKSFSNITANSPAVTPGYVAPRLDSAQGDIRNRISGLDAIVNNPTSAPGVKEAFNALQVASARDVTNQQRQIAEQLGRRGFGGMLGAGASEMLGSAQVGAEQLLQGQASVLANAISQAMQNRSSLLAALQDAVANENVVKQRDSEAAASDRMNAKELGIRSRTNDRTLKLQALQLEAAQLLKEAELGENARQFNIGQTNSAGLGFSTLAENANQFNVGKANQFALQQQQAQLERERLAEEQRQFDLLYKQRQYGGGGSGGGFVGMQRPYANSSEVSDTENPLYAGLSPFQIQQYKAGYGRLLRQGAAWDAKKYNIGHASR